MNDTEFLQNYLQVSFAAPENIAVFVLNMVITGILAHLVGRMYIKYGGTLSNRPAFAKNFVLVSITTMLVISIVKSSLALSLGLIERFQL